MIGGFQSSGIRLKLVPSAARSHFRNSKLNGLHFGYAQTILFYRFFNSSHFVERLNTLYSDVCPNLQIFSHRFRKSLSLTGRELFQVPKRLRRFQLKEKWTLHNSNGNDSFIFGLKCFINFTA